MKNLIIGGAGFIGSNLVERLLNTTNEVYIIIISQEREQKS